MNIREIATSRLREYENNPRNNDLAVEKVKYSIQRFGFLFPVVVDMNYVIVAGHTRVRACRELGIQSVPCIVADELTDEQVNFFRLVDNKTSEYSDWDFEKLKSELSLVDLTLDENQLLLERFELSAEVFDIEPEQAEIKIPAFNFMGVNDNKTKAKKPTVSTIHSTAADEATEAADTAAFPTEGTYTAPDVEPAQSVYAASEQSVPAGVSQSEPALTAGGLASGEQAAAEVVSIPSEPKKSKAVLPFCQFRFGDVAFFISQVELDRLNEKYAEYINSGAILEGSFANYLLKEVESHD